LLDCEESFDLCVRLHSPNEHAKEQLAEQLWLWVFRPMRVRNSKKKKKRDVFPEFGINVTIMGSAGLYPAAQVG
jgi:hypothetical protein